MNTMATFFLIGQLADNARGKRLKKYLAATSAVELPHEVGLCIGNGQDYQTRTPTEQRKWQAWAARPGCTLLLVPPFQTMVRHEPSDWEIARFETPPNLDSTAHPVLRLTHPEISLYISRGLGFTSNSLIDGGARKMLSGVFRKHPASGIFGITTIPIWSLVLADHIPALVEWLSAWLGLAGRPEDATPSTTTTTFEPTQRHYSVLLYLASGNFGNRAAALESLAWNDTFELGDADVTSLLDELQAAGLILDGTLTSKGRRILLDSPYRHYAEAYLNPASH